MNKRIVILITAGLSLVGCGGSSSGSSAADETAQTLPSINTALNTQTAEGIWLIHSNQTRSYEISEVKTNLDSTSTIRQVVVMRQDAAETYSMPQCGLGLIKDRSRITLGSNVAQALNTQSYNIDLSLEDNLSLSGTVQATDETAGPAFSYTDKQQAVISGVKVSDSVSFAAAQELAIEFSGQFNDEAILALNDLDSPLVCFSTSAIKQSGSQIGQTSSSSADKILLEDEGGNTASFLKDVGLIGDEAIDDGVYTSNLMNLTSSGAASCAENDSDCTVTQSFTLSLGHTLDTVTANVQATNANSESLNISFSVAIK